MLVKLLLFIQAVGEIFPGEKIKGAGLFIIVFQAEQHWIFPIYTPT
tara:strand:- start:2133 stop:2270 length:138 start_codon:yes stop_codon:yes gene_type:complete